jgi:hypothetical protein
MAANVRNNTTTDEEAHLLYHRAHDEFSECLMRLTDEKLAILFHASDSEDDGDHSETFERISQEGSIINQAAFMTLKKFKEEFGVKDFLKYSTYCSFVTQAVLSKIKASEESVIVPSVIKYEDTFITKDPSSLPIFCSNPDCKSSKFPLVNFNYFCPKCRINYCSDDCKDEDFLPHRFRVCDASNGGPSCFHRRINKQAAASI